MGDSFPSRSRRHSGPGGHGEGAPVGRAAGAPGRAAIRGVLVVVGVIGVVSLARPKEPGAAPMNIIGKHVGLVRAMALSPDGGRLASVGFDGSIRIWGVGGEDAGVVLEPGDGPIHGLAWSPDGSALATAGTYQAVSIWDARTWERITNIESDSGEARGLAWSPDGSTLAAGYTDSTIVLWDAATWRERSVLRGHTGNVNHLAFSADGRVLVSGGSDGLLGIWDGADGRRIRLQRAGALALSGLACTPGGDVFAASNTRPGAFHCRSDEPGGEDTAVDGGRSYIALATSGDGRFLAASTIDGAIDLWQLSPERPLTTLRGHSGTIRAMAFTPDGRTLLSGGSDGTIRRWDAGGSAPPAPAAAKEDASASPRNH